MSTPNPAPKQHALQSSLLSKIPVSLRLLATSTTGAFLLGTTGLWHQWMPTYLLLCLIGPSLLPSSQDTLTHRCRRALAASVGATLGLLLVSDALQASGAAPTEIQEVGLRMVVYLFVGTFAFDRLVESNSEALEDMTELIKSIGMPLLGGFAAFLLVLDLKQAIEGFPIAPIVALALGMMLFYGVGKTQTVAQNYAPIFGPLLTTAAFFSWNAAINAIFIVGVLSLIINLLIIRHRRTNGVTTTESQLETTPTP